MNIVIRKAVKKDCARMLELVKELAIYERALHEVTVTFDHFEESGFGESPVWWAFVAEVNNVVEGFALYFIRYRTWKGQYMFLEDFVVTEKLRGRGIGKLLFDKLIEEAKEKKFKGMVWQALEWNEPALNFYRKYDGVNFNREWIDCTLQLEA
jgi:GNAT superfamily N-acetyltransferase